MHTYKHAQTLKINGSKCFAQGILTGV